jgi:hypothetical protein
MLGKRKSEFELHIEAEEYVYKKNKELNKR